MWVTLLLALLCLPCGCPALELPLAASEAGAPGQGGSVVVWALLWVCVGDLAASLHGLCIALCARRMSAL